MLAFKNKISLTETMALEKVVYKNVPQKEKDAGSTPIVVPKGFGARHVQSLILFISLTVGLMMRAQLSVSLVAMTSNTTLQMWYPFNDCSRNTNISDESVTSNETLVTIAVDGHSNNSSDDKLKTHADNNEGNISRVVEMFNQTSKVKEDCKEFDFEFMGWTVYTVYNWDKPTKEMILFSFFVGYTGMMLPMGLIAQKFGGKIPIMVALGVNGVLSILTPWMPIFSGWLGVCASRLLQGMTQAAFYPSIQTLLSRWAPLSERGRLSSYIYGGSQFGTVLAFQLAGLFAGSPALGWPVSFWFFGAMSLVCCGLLAWLGAATPHDYPSISNEELVYIMGDGSADLKLKKRRTPWKQILTSPAVWGLVTTHVGSALGYIFILTQIPLYMNEILGVDIKNNGLFSSLPYIAMYVLSIFFGYLADWALNSKTMSLVNIRRVANSIGMFGLGLFLVASGYVTSTLMGVILLVLCLGTHSGIHQGFLINSIDLAPNFAGTIMALGNMLANLTSLLVPVLVSTIVGKDEKNQHKWQIMFWIVAGIQIVTNIVFLVFAKGTVQPWNFHDEHLDEEKEKTLTTEKKNVSEDSA